MRLAVVNVRSCSFDTDAYRTYFATDDTDQEIVDRLLTDNGQFAYLLGDVFGWENDDFSIKRPDWAEASK